MKRQLVRFSPWTALMVMGLIGTSQPANTQERHPRIRAAIESLREAQEYMRTAAHDFCGHRGHEGQRSSHPAVANGAGMRSEVA